MIDYKLLSPPIPLDFQNRSKDELKTFYSWYIKAIPERMEQLLSCITSTNGYEDFVLDYSPESLGKLGEWFYSQIGTRQRTEKEKNEIYQESPEWFKQIPIEEWELTNQTFSLAIDIGMYFAKVLTNNNTTLEIKHCITGRKDYIGYGQPVITGFKNKMEFNPSHMMTTLAYGFASQKQKGNRLKELYDIWIKMYT